MYIEHMYSSKYIDNIFWYNKASLLCRDVRYDIHADMCNILRYCIHVRSFLMQCFVCV